MGDLPQGSRQIQLHLDQHPCPGKWDFQAVIASVDLAVPKVSFERDTTAHHLLKSVFGSPCSTVSMLVRPNMRKQCLTAMKQRLLASCPSIYCLRPPTGSRDFLRQMLLVVFNSIDKSGNPCSSASHHIALMHIAFLAFKNCRAFVFKEPTYTQVQ